MDKKTDKSNKNATEDKKDFKRAGSTKRSKNAALTIHENKVIQPAQTLPSGSRFKGYQDFIV